ncbi:hypothetical protein CC1G_11862 [Coprinopsis cinerea okayama7|uniref:PQ loop repeat protein n=1 Tax=Coprinopsis cinerea (strain Okayama-7 / 130 / ATCC MYA-4618 / FGSC 9003) TaxID=240176 RepID=A8PH36_COPC7|nr:hypothetical protein CC1G_11862 [Coprinopsis cinerea okayama7\|eukprot:XP_001841334.2 hypothetical protein CC1G_11862 [Coprinopsis cinerea okayama7\
MLDSKGCDIEHDWFTAMLTFGLCCGLIISYLPQVLLSVVWAPEDYPGQVVGGLESFVPAAWNDLCWGCCDEYSGLLKCCSVVKFGTCVEISAGVVQLSIQWVAFSLIFVLYMIYYPENLKYLNQDFQVQTQDTVLVVKSTALSPEWKWSIVLAWAAALHFIVSAFTTAFILTTSVIEPGADSTLPPAAYSWARFLGVSAAVFASVQYAPQLLHTYRTKLVGALSIPMMCIQTPGGILMVTSIALRPGTNWTSWITFAVAAVMQGMLLVMCLFWKRRQARLRIDDFGVPLDAPVSVENPVPALVVTQPSDEPAVHAEASEQSPLLPKNTGKRGWFS